MENFNNHSEESKKVQLTKKVEIVEKKSSRKRSESIYTLIRGKAGRIFRVQLNKSVDTKKAAVLKAFEKIASGDYTLDRFLAEFNENVERLIDSKRFEEACADYKLEPFDVATHIAFDGTSKIDLVLKNGLKAIYSTQITQMVEPLFTKLELRCATDPDCPGCPEE